MPTRNLEANMKYFLLSLKSSIDEYIALENPNIISDITTGTLMFPILLLHHPTKGENNICAKGLAATMYPMNSFPASGSNCNKTFQNRFSLQ